MSASRILAAVMALAMVLTPTTARAATSGCSADSSWSSCWNVTNTNKVHVMTVNIGASNAAKALRVVYKTRDAQNVIHTWTKQFGLVTYVPHVGQLQEDNLDLHGEILDSVVGVEYVDAPPPEKTPHGKGKGQGTPGGGEGK